MLKQKYFLTGIFILSAERQPIKLSWRKIVWLLNTDILAVITDERQPFICKYRFACYSEMKARMIELID